MKLGCAVLAAAAALAAEARSAELTIVSGALGQDLEVLRQQLATFEERTGHRVEAVSMPSSSTEQFSQFRLWLAAGNPDVDVYRIDVVWAPQLASHFVDLGPHAPDAADEHFAAIIESQTVEGRLAALPMFADAAALYYRTDLLEKHGYEPPETWAELTETAAAIQEAERAAGHAGMHGFVFQGAAYEGLTCNGLEWLASHGGGTIVEPDGPVSVNNPRAAEALERAAGWVRSIAPEGVLSYQEEEARGVWQTGNAVFMRNWPYAYALGNSADSPIQGSFDVAPLPSGEEGRSASCLGGWNLAVSRYSPEPQAAIALVNWLASAEAQKQRAIANANLPTIPALYDDAEIAAAQPVVPRWRAALESAVARPSAATRTSYNEVSSEFWTAVHDVLSGRRPAAASLNRLEVRLNRLKGRGW
ncbi:MAG TPA: ABC transporter substrate-binding protein [Afifellaceae bacterium]|nr:ABC transporter substrate-binding protein [Afifellaceae bacterium]